MSSIATAAMVSRRVRVRRAGRLAEDILNSSRAAMLPMLRTCWKAAGSFQGRPRHRSLALSAPAAGPPAPARRPGGARGWPDCPRARTARGRARRRLAAAQCSDGSGARGRWRSGSRRRVLAPRERPVGGVPGGPAARPDRPAGRPWRERALRRPGDARRQAARRGCGASCARPRNASRASTPGRGPCPNCCRTPGS